MASDVSLSSLPPEIRDIIYSHLLPTKVLLNEPKYHGQRRLNFLEEYSANYEHNFTILKKMYYTNRYTFNEALSRTNFGYEAKIGEPPGSWRLPEDIIDKFQHITINIDTDYLTQHARLRELQEYHSCPYPCLYYSQSIVQETLGHFMLPSKLGIFGSWGVRPQISRGTLTVRFYHRNSLGPFLLSLGMLEALAMMTCFETVQVFLDASVRSLELLRSGFTHTSALERISCSLEQMVYGAPRLEKPVQPTTFWAPKRMYGVKAYLEHALGPATVTSVDHLSEPYNCMELHEVEILNLETKEAAHSTSNSFPRPLEKSASKKLIQGHNTLFTSDELWDSEDEEMAMVGTSYKRIRNEDLVYRRIRAERCLTFHPRTHLTTITGSGKTRQP